MSNASNYKAVMEAIATDQPVEQDLYEAAVLYAKSAKRKAPFRSDEWACGLTVAKTPAVKEPTNPEECRAQYGDAHDEHMNLNNECPWCGAVGSVVPVKKTAAKKKAKAAKSPAEKKACSEAGCPKDSYSKGLCAQHYTARRRQDPAERVKANEASRRWREKKAAAATPAAN